MAEKPTDRRALGQALARVGQATGVLGALMILGGSVAPWVSLSLFGLPLAASGVLFSGIWSACAGLLGLLSLRRVPLFTLVFALVATGIGATQGKTTLQRVSRHMLSLRLRLAPVNARLEQVHLTPIEPFGEATRAQPGPGPLFVVLGGGALALGSVGIALGARWRATCPQCRVLWPEQRLASLLYCPGCGFKRTDSLQCPRCWQLTQPTDKHCPQCGERL